MEVIGLSATFDTMGAGSAFSSVADLLVLECGDYGEAVQQLSFTAFRANDPNERLGVPTGLTGLYDDFHARLDGLPTVRFRRAARAIDIEFRSDAFSASDPCRLADSTDCQHAAAEVLDALALVRDRVKSGDAFDADRFLDDVARILAIGARKTLDWAEVHRRATARRASVRAAADPWDLLDIDWDAYHPSARRLLDDPWFWSESDSLAPHGNDTGSDLLNEYLRWTEPDQSRSPTAFLDEVMASWQITPIDWLETDPATVRSLLRVEPIAVETCNQAAIALAFALVKVHGTCPSDIVTMASAAIDRQTIALEDSSASSAQTIHQDSLDRMRATLRDRPEPRA